MNALPQLIDEQFYCSNLTQFAKSYLAARWCGVGKAPSPAVSTSLRAHPLTAVLPGVVP